MLPYFFQPQLLQHYSTTYSLGSFLTLSHSKHFSKQLLLFPFHLLPHMPNITFCILFYFLTFKTQNIWLSVPMFPQFLTSNPPDPINYLFFLNPFTHLPDFTDLAPFLYLSSHPSYNAVYPSLPTKDISWFLPLLRLGP